MTSTFLLPSCQSWCQLHLGMRLFVFISIQCFFSVFISKVPSCICQPQWKARDTTEFGSRFNRFHAISTTLWGVCLPLAGGETFPQWGFFFLEQLVRPQPLPVWWGTKGSEAAGFVPKHSWVPTCVRLQPDGLSWELAAMRSRWGEVQSAQPIQKVRCLAVTHVHTGCQQTHIYEAMQYNNIDVRYILWRPAQWITLKHSDQWKYYV